jgi:hypothetical protein
MRRKDQQALAAIGAGLIIALAAHGSHPAAGTAAPLSVASIPGGSAYTPRSWAAALLSALGDAHTPCNMGAITAWERAEGGHWANGAHFNPLNTARLEPGSYAINSAGVQSYPSWPEGFAGTLAALGNGLYGGVLSALKAGNNAQAVADQVGQSRWGTEPFTASC